ncbi:6-phosphogluconate dehydrogenase [Zopfochytrium polystomum]|nr:6-phosphogluconate dehydrogenase [Zopfochytrium polystomum]
MTFDDANLRAVVAEILATPDRSRSLVFVSCSTVDPEVVKEVAKSAQEGGVKFVSAPVFGRPDAAANKMLVWAVAGPADAKAVADPYFKAMGRLVIDCGEAPEKANIMKLTGNFLIASTIEILAESQTFADKNGVSPAAVMQLVSALFPSPVTVGYGTRIAQGQFTIDAQHPGFSIDGGIKDVGLMRKVAQRSGVALPVADVVAGHLDRAKAIDGSDNLDWAALAKAVREESGL